MELINSMRAWWYNHFHGLLTVVLTAAMAYGLSIVLEFSAVIIAILLGIMIRSSALLPDSTVPGIKWGSTSLLNLAIIGLGASLNVSVLTQLGGQSIVLIIVLVIGLLASAYLIARLFNLSKNYSFLLAMGNSICGSAAIAGSAPLIKANSQEVGLSVAVINVVGTLGLFALPVTAFFLFPEEVFSQSLFLGLGLPAVGQVTAAGFLVTPEVGQLATVIKMARILLLGPILVVMALAMRRSIGDNKGQGITFVPGFVLGFIVLTVITNLNLLSDQMLASVQLLAKMLLIAAMAAIGLSIVFKDMIKVSLMVLIAGAAIFIFHNAVLVSVLYLFLE